MRTGKTLFFAAGILAAALGAHGLGVGNAADSTCSGLPPLTKFSKLSQLIQDKCMACHTRNYNLPFYASIPGIREIIEQDYRDGLRAMDLNEEFGPAKLENPVSEPTLAKMEWVALNETMPPAKFSAVHWGSRVSSDERKEILQWVAASRAQHYATGTAVKELANEPVQPLPDSLPVDVNKVALGEKLFNDKRLSGDDTLACAGCHHLDKAGTDNQRFAEGVRRQFGDINAPTVFNAAFNIMQFWNGRAADLQEQAGGPPFNPIEMASKDWDEIIAKLNRDQTLSAEFKAVYPAGWSGASITDAIAEYEKTLITPNSSFDLWLKGRKDAITKVEADGYQRFKAYRCSSCHVGRSLGGQSFEYMDLKKDYFKVRGSPLGSDEGLKGFTQKAEDLHKFKVPNLRNIELTGPYLHDGLVTTLDEAVRIMGTYLSGMEVSAADRALIVSFLRTLTGEHEGKKLTGTVTPK
ncbi:MAG: cytochrome-c peroxidase [Desulfovibrio sp.]|jgi:cytochrome c peroxidase|nr:cytochrome-c peroxidase [Desulfovibrio sp.]